MTHETGDFLRAQFDKILLFVLLVFVTVVLMVLLWRFPNLDQSTLQWAEKSFDFVLGGLVTSITTALAMRRAESAMETVTHKPGGAVETKTESAGKTEIGTPPLPPLPPLIPLESKP